MSSRRFPGKVLAPFRGLPLVQHVVQAVRRALPVVPAVVLTSQEPSDEPLARYLSAAGIPCFRGPLDDVVERFLRCLDEHPCTWILRVSADSPLLEERVLRAVVSGVERAEVDLVTTTFPRTFPKGQNAELIRAETLRKLAHEPLTAADREHVTPFFYRHPERFRIINVDSGNSDLAALSFAVDTVEDLQRLEEMSDAQIAHLLSAPARAVS